MNSLVLSAALAVQTSVLPNGLPLHQARLANGLTLYLIENHAAPVFTYQTWFKVGAKDEKLDPRLNATGLAHLFEHMMFRGTANHPDGDFDDLLTRAGVNDENATTWNDRTNYYQSLPSDRLELVAQLESDRMVNLALNQELLDTERGAVLGEYRMGLDDPDSVAYDTLYATAFTTHPYKYTTIGTEDEIKRFTAADAQYFYKKYYAPNNATIVISGDVTPDQALSTLDKFYGSYGAQSIERPTAPVEPDQTRERTAEFRHAQLAAPKLLLGYHTPGATHADIPALHVVQAMLTDGDASILEQAWVNAGLAVSVSGNVNLFKDPGLTIIGADVQGGKDPAELVRMLDQKLSQLAMAESSSLTRSVERARNQLLLSTYSQWEDNSSLASFLGEFVAVADDPKLAFDQISALDRVTPADVQRVVRQYLIPSNRTVVVGRPVGGAK